MDQDSIFLKYEGDNWFKRNSSFLTNKEHGNDLCMGLIKLYDMNPSNVLEIGASNGWRLNEIRKQFNCKCTAVEPSECAIENGSALYPEVQFHKGLAHNLPFNDGQLFDLVIINFVFNWIDRKNLLKSVAEIDRVLEGGGFLLIGDFLPQEPCKTKYHHLKNEDVWTYKQDYSKLFTGSNLYTLVGYLTGHHETKHLDPMVDNSSKLGIFLLRKDYTNYPEQILRAHNIKS